MFFLRTTTVLLLSLTLLPAVTLPAKQKRNYNPFASTLQTQSSPTETALKRRNRKRPMDFGPFLADFDDPLELPLPFASKGRAPTGMIIDTRIPKGPPFPSHHQDEDDDEEEPEAFERENAPHEIEDDDDDDERDHRHHRSKHLPMPVNNRMPNGDHNLGNNDPDWNKVNFRARLAPNIPNPSTGPEHRRGDRPNERSLGKEKTPPRPLRNRAKQPTPRRHQPEEEEEEEEEEGGGSNQRGKLEGKKRLK